VTCQTEQQIMVREIEHARRRIARTHMRPVTTVMLVAPADDMPADAQGAAERIDAAVAP
jgi:hypothetical protein